MAVQAAAVKGPLAVEAAVRAAEAAGMGGLPSMEEAREALPELKAAHGQLGALRAAIVGRTYDGPGSEVMREGKGKGKRPGPGAASGGETAPGT